LCTWSNPAQFADDPSPVRCPLHPTSSLVLFQCLHYSVALARFCCLPPPQDLQAAFGTTDVPVICERILRTGVLQVSDREREYTSGRLFSSIASIVADKCVDAETHRPIPVGVIERSMRDLLCYSVVPGRSAKAQALEVIKALAAHMPIERAQMRLDVEAPVKWGKGVKAGLDNLVVGLVGPEEWGGGFRAVRLGESGAELWGGAGRGRQRRTGVGGDVGGRTRWT